MVTGQNHTLQKRTANSFNNKYNGRSYAQVVAGNLVPKNVGQRIQTTTSKQQLQTSVSNGTTCKNKQTNNFRGHRSISSQHKPVNPQRGSTSVKNTQKIPLQSTEPIILTQNKFALLQNLSDNDISTTCAHQHLGQIDQSVSVTDYNLKKLTFKQQKPTHDKVKYQPRGHSRSNDAHDKAVSPGHHDLTDISHQGIHTAVQTYHDNSEDNTYIQEDISIDNRIPQLIWDNRYQCSHYLECTAQMAAHFGFIPITTLQEYHGPPIHWQTIPDMLKAHKLYRVRTSKFFEMQDTNTNSS